MLDVVRERIVYRQNRGEAVIRSDMDHINGLLLEVGFKFPDLWDADFLASLDGAGEQARRRAERLREDDAASGALTAKRVAELAALQAEFLALPGLNRPPGCRPPF